MTAKINNLEFSRGVEPVTFGEILAACHRARVRVFESVRADADDPDFMQSRGFFHRLGNGERHGPFEHEDQAYEDAFLTYCLWPW